MCWWGHRMLNEVWTFHHNNTREQPILCREPWSSTLGPTNLDTRSGRLVTNDDKLNKEIDALIVRTKSFQVRSILEWMFDLTTDVLLREKHVSQKKKKKNRNIWAVHGVFCRHLQTETKRVNRVFKENPTKWFQML